MIIYYQYRRRLTGDDTEYFNYFLILVKKSINMNKYEEPSIEQQEHPVMVKQRKGEKKNSLNIREFNFLSLVYQLLRGCGLKQSLQ